MKRLGLLLLLACQPALAAPIVLNTPTGTLYGTLELPRNSSKTHPAWPIALILSGSGPTNRDGDSLMLGGENDSLRLLAEGLAARGIASVRYDKRGVGASTAAAASEADLRFDTYITDAVTWGHKLRADRRFGPLVIIGHSEGSLVGMMAAQKLGAEGFVSIAGAGQAAGTLLLEQLKPKMPPELFQQASDIIASLNTGKTVATVPDALATLFRPSVQPYLISWFRLNPATEIARLRQPVLIVQGTTDVQVKVQDAQALAKARPASRLVFVPGMNHVLKMVSGDAAHQQHSYIDPALPVAPKLIGEVAEFVNGVARGAVPKSGNSVQRPALRLHH